MLHNKWVKIRDGGKVTVSEGEYDQLIDWIHSHPEDSETYKLGARLASLPNPKQMGTKDSLIAFLKTDDYIGGTVRTLTDYDGSLVD